MTPNFAVVRVQNPHCRGFHLWVPLFLLWIPLILLSPLLVLLLLPICFLGRINLWSILAVSWAILSALPGTDVQVQAEENQILVAIH